jgi:hypothetical protein
MPYTPAFMVVHFQQTTPATTWTITHNIGTTAPIVDVWVDPDNNGVYEKIVPLQVTAISNAVVQVTFSQPFAGKASVM